MAGLADFRRQFPQYNDLTDTQLAEALHSKFYSDLPREDVFKKLGLSVPPAPILEAPKKKEGFFSALDRSFKEQASTLGLADEVANYVTKKDAASREALLKAAGDKEAEGEQGVGAFVGELLGGSLGFMAAPAAAATGAMATGVGAPAAPFVGAGVGYSQYTIQNVLRQAQEEAKAAQEGRTTEGPSLARAAVAAAPQAALDVVGGRVFGPLMKAFPFARNLVVGKIAEKTEEQLADAFANGAWKAVGNGVVRGIGKGVAFEVPQEIAQQALERWQAKLPLTGPEAAEEYKQAAIGALVLGGGVGAVSGGASVLKGSSREKEKPATEEPTGWGGSDGQPPPGFETLVEKYKTAGNSEADAIRLAAEEAATVARKPVRRGRKPSVPDVNGEAGGVGDAGEPATAGPGGVGVSDELTNVGGGTEETGDATLVAPAPVPAPVPAPEPVPTPETVNFTPQLAGLSRKERTSVAKDLLNKLVLEHPAFQNIKVPDTVITQAAVLIGGKPELDPVTVMSDILEGVPPPQVNVEETPPAPIPAPEPVPTPEPVPEPPPAPEPIPAPEPEPIPEPEPPPAPEPIPEPEPPPAPEPIPAPEPEPTPAPEPLPPKVPTPLEQKAAESAARTAKSSIVYQNGGTGLLLTLDSNNNPTYMPFNQGRVLRADVSKLDATNQGDLKLTEEELNHLKGAAERDKIISNAQHAQNPHVQFDEKGVSVSPDIKEDLKGVVSTLKDMLLPNARVYFTTFDNLNTNKENLTGNHRVLWGDVHYNPDFNAFMRKTGANEYAVVVNPKKARVVRTIELVAHELGHAHQKEYFDSAPMHIKEALHAAHKEWVSKQSGKSANEFTKALRPYETVKQYPHQAFPAEQLSGYKKYWTSFSEWYADQTARWAVSDAKPVTVVEKFFARLGAVLRNFYNTLKQKGFLPDETFVQYLNSVVKDVDLTPNETPQTESEAQDAALPTYETVAAKADEALNNGYISKPVAENVKLLAERKAMPATTLMNKLQELVAKTIDRQGVSPEGLQPAEPMGARTPSVVVPKLTAREKRSLRSQEATKLNRGVGEMFRRTRNADETINLLKALTNRISIEGLRKLLPVMTTEDITRWVGNRIGGFSQVNKLIEQLAVTRGGMLRSLAEKVPAWEKFNIENKKAGENLADLMHDSTLDNVDLTLFKNLKEALANDIALKGLRANNASKGEITKRENILKDMYARWDKLGAVANGEGQRIYKMARDSYEDMFNQHMELLKQKIEASDMSKVNKERTLAHITKQFQEAKKVGIYFPLMRYGKYWVRVGKGRGSEFYMFESGTARDLFVDNRQAELDKAGDTRSITAGDNVADLRDQLGRGSDGSSAMLKDIFNLLEDGNISDLNAVKDQVYQMYLMTLPEKDMRRRFAHRKGVTGYSADALRNFIVSHNTAAHQLSRLEYAPKIRNALGAVYGTLAGNPDKLNLIPFVDELTMRATAEISPTVKDPNGIDWDKLASLGNKATFVWMLSSPKTALVQLTQLPIVGMPVLTAKYGLKDTLAMAGRYSNLFNKLGITKRNENGEIVTQWGSPSVAESRYVQNHPDPEVRKALLTAWNEANSRDMFMATHAADMSGRSRTSSDQYQGPLSKASRGVMNLMTGAFHNMESINRQIMYMSSFELEFNKLRKEGVNAADATRRAVNSALDITNEAQFNYSQYNKPRAFKSPVGKVAFQFMTYPMQMTSFLVRNFHNSLHAMDKAERREAAIKFYGTMGMTAMFSGVTGLGVGPLSYSMIIGVAEGVREALRGDDDDDYDDDDLDNPLGKRSLDLWFRESFLPQYFGPESSVAKALGLSEEQANMLVRGVKSGPISALTDLNIGASTSLDGLYFRNDSPAQTNKEAFQQFVVSTALGPMGSMISQGFAAFDDFNNGDFNRGVEKLLPALMRGPATAYRYATQGNLTPQGEEVKNAEWYTTGKLVGQSLGVGSTEVADIQKSNILAKRMVAQIESDRNNLLKKTAKAIMRFSDNPTDANEAALDSLMEKIDEFNLRNSIYPITGETLSSSVSGRSDNFAKAIDGLVVSDRFAPYVRDILSDTRPE